MGHGPRVRGRMCVDWARRARGEQAAGGFDGVGFGRIEQRGHLDGLSRQLALAHDEGLTVRETVHPGHGPSDGPRRAARPKDRAVLVPLPLPGAPPSHMISFGNASGAAPSAVSFDQMSVKSFSDSTCAKTNRIRRYRKLFCWRARPPGTIAENSSPDLSLRGAEETTVLE